MLTKLMNQVKGRIGSPHIDLLLDKNEFMPGEKVTGSFVIKGGLFEQKLSRLECDLLTGSDEAPAGDAIMIFMSEHIPPNASKRIPFSFQLPEQLSESRYYFQTKLCFGEGKKCIGQDPIRVVQPSFS
ncbi:sporulation protein [Domibacillus sp. 8LH]|uniref:sporulation protein n=1 Tax=Domibacillus TaxID=1433999 RepID=UPI00203C91FF|nr:MULTISPECIES: sporulation protein [Domibacillus]MCM3787864.1 sporulation protein [Domibacillus indicus]WNS80004.1 sporulation protein [Domibacillus sp. DTU_2020_1001157_1_SI_ALB_TIR_016]